MPRSVERRHWSEQHHPAQVESRDVGDDVVAQLLREEIDGAAKIEAAAALQPETRIHLERIDGAMRLHRTERQALERQLRRELRQLREREGPSDHVEVERLTACRVHGCATNRM